MNFPLRQGYMPAVLALRSDVPAYDERFRGPGSHGRAAQTADMARHLSFGVHPAAFVLALPLPGPQSLATAEATVVAQVRGS
jgi:hypothetical protein